MVWLQRPLRKCACPRSLLRAAICCDCLRNVYVSGTIVTRIQGAGWPGVEKPSRASIGAQDEFVCESVDQGDEFVHGDEGTEPRRLTLLSTAHRHITVREDGDDGTTISDTGKAVLAARCETWDDAELDAHLYGARLPLEQHIWGEWANLSRHMFPLSPTGLRDSMRPLGYEGDRRRFSEASAKLLRGEPLRISVLGGSETVGIESTIRWPDKLEEHFQALGYNVSVESEARRMTDSNWALYHFSDMPSIARADVILVDYDINDYFTGYAESHTHLLAMLLALPSRPAVLDLKVASSAKSPGCTTSFEQFIYEANARDINVPLASFPDAVCYTGHTWWLHNNKLSSPWPNSLHPSERTHDLIARFIIGIIALEMNGICQRGIEGEEHELPVGKHEDFRASCLNNFGSGTMDNPAAHHSYKSESVKAVNSTVWRFGADAPGRPMSWIAKPDGRGGEISFKVRTHVGWIQMEFLATYENIGSLSCWIDDHPEKPCNIPGLWKNNYSVSRFAYMWLGSYANTLEASRGFHTLHCRSDGRKFNIFRVVSC